MRLRSKPVHPLTLISARIDRAITPGESRFLDAHMPSCESCQKQDASLREIFGMLEAHRVPQPPPQALKQLLERLRESGAPQSEVVEPTAVSPARGNAVKSWMLIVAALLLVLVIAAVLTGMQRRQPAPPAESVLQEVQIFPTSMTAPPQTYETGIPEPTGQSIVQFEVFEPPSRPAPRPAVAAPPPPKPRLQAAPSRTVAVVDAPAATASPGPPPVVVQRDDGARPERPPFVQQTFETLSLHFGGNGKNLSKESRRTLEDMAAWMQSRDDIRLLIQPHTVPRKSSKKTRELSRKRALAVARYLKRQGVDPSRLRQEEHEKPTSPLPGENDDGEARSDRVDLVPLR